VDSEHDKDSNEIDDDCTPGPPRNADRLDRQPSSVVRGRQAAVQKESPVSSFSLAPSRTVLADRVLPRSLVTDASLVVGGAALTAVLAQVAIPLWPVPITGQTLAVLLVGASLGAPTSA
jgi:hypothetical protein